mmetsp:Transcript_24403/g.21649  ORF Transcript_24403/g.21649 Transcript_24403/m.21649 type:complete len:155 (+) Transcript_24403:31-495(+)
MKNKEIELISKLKSTTTETNKLKDKISQDNIEYKNKLRSEELNKYNDQEDEFIEVELVRLKEIAHLTPIIEFCFQVHEEQTFKFLFNGTKNVSIEIAEKYFKEKLNLGNLDAFLLARYIIEPREQTIDGKNVLQRDRTAYRREITSRLKSLGYK